MSTFFTGLGAAAIELLSANLGRAGARLVTLVAEEQRRFMAAPLYQDVVELREFRPTRATDKTMSGDRFWGLQQGGGVRGMAAIALPGRMV
jgi:type III restriction enzyme